MNVSVDDAATCRRTLSTGEACGREIRAGEDECSWHKAERRLTHGTPAKAAYATVSFTLSKSLHTRILALVESREFGESRSYVLRELIEQALPILEYWLKEKLAGRVE